MTQSSIRKIYLGIADRRQMLRLFDRHAERPRRWETDDSALFAGEWFEIARAEHDYMLDLLPPLWMRGEMFAMREFLIESVTSLFYTLRIDGRTRYFHAYCDLSQPRSPVETRDAIVERESWPVTAMTRAERIEHVWSATDDAYRGYAGERFVHEHRGKRTILVHGLGTTELRLLDDLRDEEIAARLPAHLRHLPLRAAT